MLRRLSYTATMLCPSVMATKRSDLHSSPACRVTRRLVSRREFEFQLPAAEAALSRRHAMICRDVAIFASIRDIRFAALPHGVGEEFDFTCYRLGDDARLPPARTKRLSSEGSILPGACANDSRPFGL